MPETRQARVVYCHQSAAGNWGAIYRERAQSAAREVSLQDQGVMAGAKNDAVKDRVHPEELGWGAHPPRVLLDATRVQLFRYGFQRFCISAMNAACSALCSPSWSLTITLGPSPARTARTSSQIPGKTRLHSLPLV